MYVLDNHEFAAARGLGQDLAIFKCEEFGLCVRALANFRQGAVLDAFTGRISEELTQHSLQVSDGLHISDTQFIGYLSHGCDPNTRLDMERFELIALRDIVAGELLTLDYAKTEDILYRQFACGCGALQCRGWITGRNEVPNEEGRYFLAQSRKRASD